MLKQTILMLLIPFLLLCGCDDTSTSSLLNGEFIPTNPEFTDTNPPSIISPDAGEVELSLTALLSWTSCAGAEYYTIEVFYDSDCTQPYDTITVEAPLTYYQLKLDEAGTYYWRIRSSVTAADQYSRSQFDAEESFVYVNFPYDSANPDVKPDDYGRTGTIDNPFQTINRAIAEAYRLGINAVAVASRIDPNTEAFGAYKEDFYFREGIHVYGGYDPATMTRDDGFSANMLDNPNETWLEGKYGPITINDIHLTTRINRFVIRAQTANGLEINRCSRDLTLGQCVISGTSAGIHIVDSDVSINRNIISSGDGSETRYGVNIESGDPAMLDNVVVAGSSSSDNSYGIYNGGDPVLVNNTIIGGSASNASYGLYNGTGCIPLALNNIIMTSDTTDARYGVYGSSAATDTQYYYNCVNGNGGTNAAGITPATGNITVKPVFAGSNDYRLDISSGAKVKNGAHSYGPQADYYTGTSWSLGVLPASIDNEPKLKLDITLSTRSSIDEDGVGWSMGAYEFK